MNRMVTGKIENTTGKIENDTGVISGKIPEITEESDIARYRGQRGPDKKKRNFPAQTLKNLPQFRDKPHEVRQYILETRGVDIGSNFNWKLFAIGV